MFGKWLRRPKSRVFLGTLAVLPRTDWKRYLEWSSKRDEVDQTLRQTLIEIFALPLAEQVEDPLDSDLCLDVAVPSFQTGAGGIVHASEVIVPFLWRPKVTVVGRLRYLKSGQTKKLCKVTEKLPWREFFSFDLSSWFWGRSRGRPERMQKLLYLACIALLERLRKFV